MTTTVLGQYRKCILVLNFSIAGEDESTYVAALEVSSGELVHEIVGMWTAVCDWI